MDDFFKNIKEDSITNAEQQSSTPSAPLPPTISEVTKKEENIINNTEENIRNVLGKTDTDIIDVDEISSKLNEITEQSRAALEELKSQSTNIVDTARMRSESVLDNARANFSVLTKSSGMVEPPSSPEKQQQPQPQPQPQPENTPEPEQEPPPAPPQRTLTDTILSYLP